MDLDDELLALAGGDSSDGEVEEKQKERSPRREGSTKPAEGNESEDEEDGVVRQPKREAGRSRGREARHVELDEEEVDNAPSSPSRASLRSASMSESDSEGGDEDDEDKPVFPYDKLFYSVVDKEEVMNLPEIQREEILSDRAQQVDRHNQDIALRRLLASREREEALRKKKKKRKGSPADLDDSPRKSTRQKMTVGGSRKVGEASNAIEAYKRQREQKEKREKARQLRETAGGRKSTSEDVADVERERESSDVEWEDPRRRSVSPPRDDPPAALVDVNRARIGRSGFAKLCFYPGFDESISLCFVRLSIGLNKQTGQNEYRLAQIKKFVEGKPYAMEGSNRRNFVTTQYAVLAHGKAERPFPFIACSDQPFTEAEYNRWRQTMVVDDCRIPTKSQVAQKVIDINNLLNRSFTQEELDEKLRKQGAADSKQRVFEKIQLERRRADAVAAGNDALVEECDQEIRRLVGPQKLAYGTSTRRRDDGKPRTKDQGERLAELNRRNARLNTENVRKAQIAEMKRKKEQLIKIRKGEAKPDPFARVQTRARIHYDVQPDGRMVPLESSQSQVSATLPPVGASGETNSQEETEKTETPDTNSATKAKASNGADSNNTPPNRNHSRDVLAAMPPRKGDKPSVRSAPLDEDYINALNIDIDIDM